jgi:hypothetical protein
MHTGGHISKSAGFMMILCALCVDGAQAILTFLLIGFFLNPIIDIFVAILFAMWFSHHGVSMMSTKNIGPFLATVVAEFIPGISALPVWTGGVALTIMRNRVKEAVSQ